MKRYFSAAIASDARPCIVALAMCAALAATRSSIALPPLMDGTHLASVVSVERRVQHTSCTSGEERLCAIAV